MVAERGNDQDNERDRELPRDNTLKSNNEVVSLRVPRGGRLSWVGCASDQRGLRVVRGPIPRQFRLVLQQRQVDKAHGGYAHDRERDRQTRRARNGSKKMRAKAGARVARRTVGGGSGVAWANWETRWDGMGWKDGVR